MTPWEKVVQATAKHNLDHFTFQLGEDGRVLAYYQCTCYPAEETFRESWQFTDHIRRIVFDALAPELTENLP